MMLALSPVEMIRFLVFIHCMQMIRRGKFLQNFLTEVYQYSNLRIPTEKPIMVIRSFPGFWPCTRLVLNPTNGGSLGSN